jgi:N utilization substance protein A
MINNTNIEILQIAESVAKDKGLSRDIIITSMERAIESAGRKKYGQKHNIKAEINHNTGAIRLYKLFDIVENPEDLYTEISLKDAKQRYRDDVQIGEVITQELPPIDLGRVASHNAKQVIVQELKNAEKAKEYEDFKDRIGEVLIGIVKRIEFGNVIVDLGRTEAVINKPNLLKTDNYRINDRIKSYIKDIKRDNINPQIQLSRTDDMMVVKLFEIEVPEIEEKMIEVRAVARDPGSRAKIAVFSKESGLDAVGSCIGMKGSRVKAVMNELNGEKIDVINWDPSLAKYTINSLAPAKIEKVIIDEESHKIEVIVSEDQLSIAIGRQGQNVRLASKLIGWNIDILSDNEESKRKLESFKNITENLIASLDLDETLAQLLATEGFSSIEEIANIEIEELASIEGIEESMAIELIEKANVKYNEKLNQIIESLEKLGVEQELLDITIDINPEDLIKLAEYGIKTLEDLGDMTVKEFKNVVINKIYRDEEIEELINLANSSKK